MRPRWVTFAAAGALGAEVASWIYLFGGLRWQRLDPAMAVAVFGLHLFAAVLLAEGTRASAPGGRGGDGGRALWSRSFLLALLLPAAGPLWVAVGLARKTHGDAGAEQELDAPFVDPSHEPAAEEWDDDRGGAAFEGDELRDVPALVPRLALMGLGAALGIAAIALGWAQRPLALWALAVFAAGLVLATLLSLRSGAGPVSALGQLVVALVGGALAVVAALGVAQGAADLEALRAGPVIALPPLVLLAALLVLAFPLLVAHRWLAEVARRQAFAADLAPWAAGGQWLSLALALAALAMHVGAISAAALLCRLVLVLTALICAEVALRALGGALSPGATVSPRSLLLEALTSGRNPITALLDALEAELGLSFRSSFTVSWVRRALGPLLLLLLLLLWASSALYVVGPTEQAVVYRFGRLVGQGAVGPGLHLKAPWPVDEAQRRVVTRVRHLEVGTVGRRGSRSLLWTSRHAKTEHKLLLGDGRELLSVNALIDYRIGDLRRYLEGYRRPEELLQALAYRILFRRTADKPLATLLRDDRAAFSQRLAKDLRQACANRRLGLEVLRVSLLGLHPPVEVAPAYQGVVSAQLGIRAETLKAETDGIKRKEKTAGQAAEQVLRAEAKVAERLGRAEGEARRFGALLAGQRETPLLYRFRKRLEVLEARLAGLDLYLLDPRVARQANSLWIDLSLVDNR